MNEVAERAAATGDGQLYEYAVATAQSVIRRTHRFVLRGASHAGAACDHQLKTGRVEIRHGPPVWVVIWLICGGIAVWIGQKKNLPTRDSFIYGAVLGIIGIIIVLCQKPGLP